jgi:hypothetical protein
MEHRLPAPEADVLEQSLPAGPEPEPVEPLSPDQRMDLVPEADVLEQSLPADRELLEDDE